MTNFYIIILSILFIFEIYVIFCVCASIYLKKRYNRIYHDFNYYVKMNYSFPCILYYPIYVLFINKTDDKFKLTYSKNKLKESYMDPNSKVIVKLKKYIKKQERKNKLEKIKKN